MTFFGHRTIYEDCAEKLSYQAVKTPDPTMKDQELIDSVNEMLEARENKLLTNTPCFFWLCLFETKVKIKVEPLQLPDEPIDLKQHKAKPKTQ